ncbi:hypothetical protein AG1IA_04845 [Rhizoctonia solani AG-1 IA]|uniref:Uncharacterized protein n=1 Tax=Thanatephorus cucumeris (strain AG1-IA) TaxID=983506 RepID=L8WWB6_THACA|nr:hypothetical protein AG1IA_04845 [Rhizoctonia solani AG-1 IA]
MDSLTTVQAPNTTANEHHSEKFGWDGTDSQLSVPPQVAVRTRSINEGIEMRVLARGGSVGDPTLLEDDDHDTSESETSSRKEWTVVIPKLALLRPLPLYQSTSPTAWDGDNLAIGGVFQAVAYAVLVPALPFPVMAVADNLRLSRYWVTRCLGQRTGHRSSKQSLGKVRDYSCILRRWCFYFARRRNTIHISSTLVIPIYQLLGQVQLADSVESGSKERKYKQVFGSPAVHLMAIFCLFYVGAETTLGGEKIPMLAIPQALSIGQDGLSRYTSSFYHVLCDADLFSPQFVVEERGGGMSAGYTSRPNAGSHRVDLAESEKRRVVYGYLLLAIGLQVTVWILPNLLGNAIAFALVGVLMVVPKWYVQKKSDKSIGSYLKPFRLLTGAMVGQAGGALFPFLTGTLIQKYGVHILQPVGVAIKGRNSLGSPWNNYNDYGVPSRPDLEAIQKPLGFASVRATPGSPHSHSDSRAIQLVHSSRALPNPGLIMIVVTQGEWMSYSTRRKTSGTIHAVTNIQGPSARPEFPICATTSLSLPLPFYRLLDKNTLNLKHGGPAMSGGSGPDKYFVRNRWPPPASQKYLYLHAKELTKPSTSLQPLFMLWVITEIDWRSEIRRSANPYRSWMRIGRVMNAPSAHKLQRFLETNIGGQGRGVVEIETGGKAHTIDPRPNTGPPIIVGEASSSFRPLALIFSQSASRILESCDLIG